MKKVTLMTLCLCCFNLLNAQKIEVGVKGGINFSKLDQPDEKFLTGINGGIFAQVKLGKVKMQPEVAYSQQGLILNVTYYNANGNLIGSEDLKFKFNYLNVPVLAKLELRKGFNFHFGPQVGFIINAKYQQTVPNGNGTVTNDLTKHIRTDFSCILGFDYEFPVGIIFDGRYNVGLTDTGMFNGDNRVLQISVGYKLFKF